MIFVDYLLKLNLNRIVLFVLLIMDKIRKILGLNVLSQKKLAKSKFYILHFTFFCSKLFVYPAVCA